MIETYFCDNTNEIILFIEFGYASAMISKNGYAWFNYKKSDYYSETLYFLGEL